jgi:dTDP-4-amino-4,6-dideoxygalactose transaminase
MPTTSRQLIPIAQPLISDEDKRRVVDVLESGQLVAGPRVAEFERGFGAYVGAPHAVATSSGSTALMAALRACGIGPGDRVVTTPFSYGATASTILSCGAEPLFADIDPRTYNLDAGSVAEVLRREPRARAILIVHLYGLPCAMDRFEALAKSSGAMLIEDAAQAHGAAFRGRRAGAFGRAAAFSFYPSKNITTGEGGMVTTADPGVADRARLFVRGGERQQYQYEAEGYNYRMTEMAAALGIGQLTRLDGWNERRRRNAAHLTAGLKDLAWLACPVEPDGCHHVYHQYTVRVPKGRDALRRHLEEEGIGTRIYYPAPIHTTPFYRGRYGASACPEAVRAAEQVLSLPVHPGVGEEDLDRIVNGVTRFRPGT